MPFLASWLRETWHTLAEAAPWLLGGFLLAGLLHVLLSTERIARHLGRPGWSSIFKAALIGIPLPLCSCSVIPLAAALRRRGASRGATASFLISTPETGVDSIALTYALLGPVMAVARPLTALVTAVLAGGLIGRFAGPGADFAAPPEPASSCCSGDSCGAASRRPRARLREAVRFGLVDMFEDLAPWLVSGFLLAGLVAALLPADFFERHLGTGLPAMLLMALVGLPLYVCATSSTPIAAALVLKGLGPGAALVFLLVGPATNVATMLIVARELGKRGLALYLASITAVAFAAGLTLDALAATLPAVAAPSMDDTPGPLAWLAALATIALTLNGLHHRWRKPPATASRVTDRPAVTDLTGKSFSSPNLR